MTDRIRIAVVTTTRAEFHILEPLLSRLDVDERFGLQLIVSGTHLSEAHGATIYEIRGRFPEVVAIDAQFESSDPEALVNSCALLSIGIAAHLRRNPPDLLVLLGDRFELLAVAQAALLLEIPIAHLHGGETTLGAIDDVVRHALTQLASLHLVAADVFAERVRALGVESSSVHVVGALGVEAVLANYSDDREEALRATGLQDGPYVVVALHPETRGSNSIEKLFESVRGALDPLGHLGAIVTHPNTDNGGDELSGLLKEWCLERPNTRFIESLGDDFATVVGHAEAIVGNSSSGLIEAPALGTPSINIGDRQLGRPLAPSVRTVPAEPHAVRSAIENVRRGADLVGPLVYSGGGVSGRVVDALLDFFSTDRENVER